LNDNLWISGIHYFVKFFLTEYCS